MRTKPVADIDDKLAAAEARIKQLEAQVTAIQQAGDRLHNQVYQEQHANPVLRPCLQAWQKVASDVDALTGRYLDAAHAAQEWVNYLAVRKDENAHRESIRQFWDAAVAATQTWKNTCQHAHHNQTA
jgi:hypothetical protein